MGSSCDGIQVGNTTMRYVVDSNHKGSDFSHPTAKDVRRIGCDGWSLRAKKSNLLVAQEKQHLQEVKERLYQHNHL